MKAVAGWWNRPLGSHGCGSSGTGIQAACQCDEEVSLLEVLLPHACASMNYGLPGIVSCRARVFCPDTQPSDISFDTEDGEALSHRA